jgi:predicted transcriptional regulator
MQDQNAFRKNLKSCRQNLGVSQDQLAALSGVSRPIIASFESGRANLSTGNMESIRKALLKVTKKRESFFRALPSALSFRGEAGAEA